MVAQASRKRKISQDSVVNDRAAKKPGKFSMRKYQVRMFGFRLLRSLF